MTEFRQDTWGAMGGLQAGYNWQFGNVLAGIEAVANILGAGSTQTNSAWHHRLDKVAGLSANVRPRLGFAF
jgi:hypothetical protein